MTIIKEPEAVGPGQFQYGERYLKCDSCGCLRPRAKLRLIVEEGEQGGFIMCKNREECRGTTEPSVEESRA